MPDKPVELFYCYSHKDEELRDELEKHLSILKREKVIAGWHDRRIGAGKEWKGQIDAHLNSAAVILLLISSDFLASDYCYDVEMKRALERHDAGEARVIPVILRAVDWKGAPFGKLQCLPTDAKPVTSWTNRDEAFRDVAQGIRQAVEELLVGSATKPAGVVWNVPRARNPNFTGREEMLADLRAALTSGQAAALTQVPQAIHGLGGVGKTQLAIEYAYRHRAEYSLVWWVRAEEPAALAGDYAAMAAALDLPQKEAREQAVVVEAVRRWLEQNTGWLLVFDNAGEPTDVRDYLPRSAGGHVIITSRNPAWGAVARPLGVQVFERPTSVEFLLKRTGQADQEAAGKLAEALGDLPLALEQAVAYIEATGESVSGYLRMFRERQAELLKRPSPSSDTTVATTWELSFQQVDRRSPAAAALLNLCAFLAPDDISLDIVQQAPKLPEPLAEAAADAVQFDDAIGALRRFSLVSRSGDVLSVHRLVQAVTRERLAEEARKRWAAAAARTVNRAFPIDSDDVRTWPVCSRLLAHALAAADHCEPLKVAADETGRLLNQAGVYLKGRAEFARARACFERALKIAEAAYGPDHPKVAIRVNNLGRVLHDQGDLAGARACFERALKIDEAAYGPEHPNVARDVNNLGGVLQDQGDLAAAWACFERALKIYEAAYGPEHPNVATCVNNLGRVLHDQGDLAGARACLERALKIDEAAYGPDHPEVARAVNNLGSVLQDQGDLAGARACCERALKVSEAAYGPEHPTVAIRVNNLGGVLKAEGDLAGARACFERALGICRRFLGESHPNTVLARKNLELLG
jgi:tetratricopeptide (TPR) repeat protein